MDQNNPQELTHIEQVRQWLYFAGQDLRVAELSRHQCLIQLASFNCHQALEKTFKAYYLLNNRDLPDSHYLVDISMEFTHFNPPLNLPFQDLLVLDRYFIQTIFPESIDPSSTCEDISDEELKQALKISRSIINTLAKYIQPLLKNLQEN